MDERLWPASDQLLLTLMALPPSAFLVVAALLIAIAAFAVVARASYLRRLREEEAARRREQERRCRAAESACRAAGAAIGRAQAMLLAAGSTAEPFESRQRVVDEVFGALGELHVVASEATLQSTAALAAAFASAQMLLQAKARPLTELRLQIERMDAKIAHLGYERDQLLAGLTRLAGEGLGDQGGMWSDMNLRFDRLEREIASTLELRTEKLGERVKLEQQLEVDAAQGALKIAKLAVPACLALRREAGMAVDEEDYRALAEASLVEFERGVRSLAGDPSKSSATPPRPAAPAASAAAAKSPEVRLRMALKGGN